MGESHIECRASASLVLECHSFPQASHQPFRPTSTLMQSDFPFHSGAYPLLAGVGNDLHEKIACIVYCQISQL